MPDPQELPRVLGAVEALVGAGSALIAELVANRIPGCAAVVGALNHLARPAAALRGIDPVGISRRSLDVVDLPTAEERPLYVPHFALAVRGENKGTLSRTGKNTHTAHGHSLRWPTPGADREAPSMHLVLRVYD